MAAPRPGLGLRPRLGLRLGLWLSLGLGLAACSRPAPPAAPPPAPTPPPVEAPAAGPGQQPWSILVSPTARLGVVWAGQLGGRIEAAGWGSGAGGGLGRRAAYLAWVRKANPSLPLLHLEAGDSMDADPQRARVLLDSFARMGLDAYNVGAGELEAGLGPFLETVRASKLPFLSTNLVLAGQRGLVPAYRLMRVATPGGPSLRVLVLGVSSWGERGPVGLAFADFEDARAAIPRTLAPLRGTADITLLLASGYEPRKLACALEGVTGIDLVLASSGELQPGQTLMSTCNQRVALGGYGGFWLSDLRLFQGDDGWLQAESATPLLDYRHPEVEEIARWVAAVPPFRPRSPGSRWIEPQLRPGPAATPQPAAPSGR